MENRQGETRRIESPMLHSYVPLPRLSPTSLSPISLSFMSLAYLAPLTLPGSLPYVYPLRGTGERDKGESDGRGAGERDEGEREKGDGQRREARKRDKGEEQRRETRERDKGEGQGGETRGERHQETPHTHSLAPPHTFNLSITVLPQIHLNVEVLLVYLYMLVAKQESAL